MNHSGNSKLWASVTGAACSVCVGTYSNNAADWPQYRGPNYDGSSPEKISKVWPSNGPRQIWRMPLTGGFSSFVHSGNILCTLVLRVVDGVNMEACVAFDPDTGHELWCRTLEVAKYTGIGDDSGNAGAPGLRGGDGPRSTPAIDDGDVFVISSGLKLFCLSGASGDVIWVRNLIQEFEGTRIPYENAASPVLMGDRIFLAGGGPGQSLLCLDKHNGTPIWKAHDEVVTHSTPAIATLDQTPQVVFFTRSGLVAVNPEDGKLLWRYRFRFRVSAAITPVVAGDLVYCSAGYGIGSSVCRVAKTSNGWGSTEIWRNHHNEPVASHWSTPVHRKGFLYGIFGFKKYLVAPLKCVEMSTGTVNWSQPGFGHGNVILVDDHLLALTGYGTLILVRPSPDAYQEIARAEILAGKCWSTPIVSNGRIYARSTMEGVCLDISPELD